MFKQRKINAIKQKLARLTGEMEVIRRVTTCEAVTGHYFEKEIKTRGEIERLVEELAQLTGISPIKDNTEEKEG